MTDIPPLEQPCGGPALATLRRLDAGELESDERARVQGHVDGCASCRAVLADFAADRSAARIALPFATLDARIAWKKSPFASLRRAWMYVALPLAGAVAAFALVPRTATTNEDPPGIRRKGAQLDYLVKTGDGSRAGSSNEPLHPGDRIRFRYDSQGKRYVLIVGVDADGKVFPYAANGDRSLPSAGPGLNLVNNAVTLDGDVRPEKVFALFSNEPLAVDEVRPAAKDALAAAHGDVTHLEKLPVPGVDEDSVLLRKAP